MDVTPRLTRAIDQQLLLIEELHASADPILVHLEELNSSLASARTTRNNAELGRLNQERTAERSRYSDLMSQVEQEQAHLALLRSQLSRLQDPESSGLGPPPRVDQSGATTLPPTPSSPSQLSGITRQLPIFSSDDPSLTKKAYPTPEKFISRFTRVLSTCGVPSALWYRFLSAQFADDQASWIAANLADPATPPDQAKPWPEIQEGFLNYFSGLDRKNEYVSDFHEISIQPQESISDFCDRFQFLRRKALKEDDDADALYLFRTKLPTRIQEKLLSDILQARHSGHPIITVSELAKRARSYSKILPFKKNAPQSSAFPPSSSPYSSSTTCLLHPSARHSSRDCNLLRSLNANDSCPLHVNSPHPVSSCRALRPYLGSNPRTSNSSSARPTPDRGPASRSQPATSPSSPSSSSARNVICYRCQKPGHIATRCPQNSSNHSFSAAASSLPSGQAVPEAPSNSDSNTFAAISPASRGTTYLTSTTPSSPTSASNAQKEMEHLFLALGSGSPLQSQAIKVPLQINGVHVLAFADTLATLSFINPSLVARLNLSLVPATGGLTLADNSRTSRTSKTTPIPVKCGGLEFTHSFDVISTCEDIELVAGLDVLNKIGFSISFPFHSDHPFVLSLDCKPSLASPDPNLSESRSDLLARLDPLLEANKAIPIGSFCNHPLAVVTLDTGSAKPIFRRQYPVAHRLQPVVDEQIEEWLAAGIIEAAPDDCPWNSPLLVVPKPNSPSKSEFRVCLDPRPLNELLPDSPNKTPLIQDIFNSLSGSEVFTVLDYLHSFLQLQIALKDRPKTCFTWRNIRYWFVGAPFGIKPLTGIMQSVQFAIFKHLAFVLTYVDDLVIHSSSFSEHIHHVEQVLVLLNRYNIKLKIPKAVFLASVITLLGHTISANRIMVDPKKLVNLETWPLPSTPSAINSFLGFTNYFRNFIPKYSSLAAPLEALRAKGSSSFSLNHAQRQAFEALRQAILLAPVLHLPDFSLPFHIATDASSTGIGAVLYQIVGKTKRFIQFQARALSASERNYSATKRECLAIIFALAKFHYYVYANRFILYTDHRALTFMFTQKHVNAITANWFETLLSYDFEIRHLPGIQNLLPDRLSRLFPPSISDAPNQVVAALSTPDASSSPTPLQLPPSAEPPILSVPPFEARADLLLKAHLAGHFGQSAVINTVRLQGFDWPGLSKDALELVASCPDCQRFNIARHGYHPLTPISASLPFDHVAIDLAGPLPTSHAGFNYILIHLDVLTRFVLLRPLHDKTSDTIAKTLFHLWTDFGFPPIIQSDNGTEFVNSVVKSLLSTDAMDHRLISPYNPRANGLAERFVQSTKAVLRKLLGG